MRTYGLQAAWDMFLAEIERDPERHMLIMFANWFNGYALAMADAQNDNRGSVARACRDVIRLTVEELDEAQNGEVQAA